MDDLNKITELINQKYHLESITPLKKITNSNIDNIMDVHAPFVNREFLLDPINKDKYMMHFRDLKNDKCIEIITGDKKAIDKAKEYQSYLNQPVGILIQATCVAMGSGSSDMMVSYIDNLIPSLADVSGWKFKKLGRAGAFSADIKIYSTDEFAKEKALDILQTFFNSLSVATNVGYRIQHYSVSPIPRHVGPYQSGQEQWEHNIPPLSQKEADKIIKIMNADQNVKIAAEGLNQAYIENLLPSRVARLWATVEHILDSESVPLFKRAERRALIRKIKKFENYDDDKIEKINYALSNLNTEGRNERIAKNISNLMNITFAEAYDKVKNVSKARGNNVHEIRNNWDMLKESEIFLQDILLRFIDNNSNKLEKC